MHVVVTGGAGFIGSNLIRTLFREEPGIRVTCIDNFDPFYPAAYKQQNIQDFKTNPDFRFVYEDISTLPAEELAAQVEEPVDVIVHLAAKAGVRPSIENPLAYQQNNVIGLQRMLDFALLKEVPQFVFASSSSVYGVNDHFPWREEETLLPISPYAMTKLAGEMLGHVYTKLYPLRFIALRFFTVYGPGQRPDLAIHKFTRSIFNETPLPFYGDGSTSRDYTYVDDTIQGVRAAMRYTGSDFEIINLGNHYAVTLRELVSVIEKVTGKKAVLEPLPAQPGDVPKTYADIDKARRLLGYNPQTGLEDGIRKFVDWYQAGREWLEAGL